MEGNPPAVPAVSFNEPLIDVHGCDVVHIDIPKSGGLLESKRIYDGPIISGGYHTITDKPGYGIELNEDVARAHLAPGETWWLSGRLLKC